MIFLLQNDNNRITSLDSNGTEVLFNSLLNDSKIDLGYLSSIRLPFPLDDSFVYSLMHTYYLCVHDIMNLSDQMFYPGSSFIKIVRGMLIKELSKILDSIAAPSEKYVVTSLSNYASKVDFIELYPSGCIGVILGETPSIILADIRLSNYNTIESHLPYDFNDYLNLVSPTIRISKTIPAIVVPNGVLFGTMLPFYNNNGEVRVSNIFTPTYFYSEPYKLNLFPQKQLTEGVKVITAAINFKS